MTTGQRIKAARKKAGMTQADLAKKLGISYVNISQLETDQRSPKLETLQRIAAALGTSISNLLPPDNYWEDEDGVGHTEPQVVEHEGPLQRAEVVEHSATPEELEALMAKLQDGKPLVLSPDDLAKLKATPKERVAAALDAQGERGEIVKIAAPIYRLRGGKIPRQAGKVHPYPTLDKAQYKGELVKELIEKIEGQAGPSTRYEHSLGTTGLATPLLGQLNAPQRRIAAALDKLNEEGQEKAAERVEELTEIPRYQATPTRRSPVPRTDIPQPPAEPPQSPPAAQEGKDTTPPPEGAEGPQKGK